MKRYWENLRPFEKRVVAGVATMLFIIFNVWFVWPHFSDWGRIQKRMEQARWTLGTRQAEVAQIPHYDAQIKKLQGEGQDVVEEDQALQFQRKVTEEQVRSSVRPGSAGRISTRTNQFFLEQTQTITTESGEQQLVDFLYNLGAGTSQIRVRDLGLRPNAAHQELAASIKLVASYQKKAAPKAAVPGTRRTGGRLAGTQPPANVSTKQPNPRP